MSVHIVKEKAAKKRARRITETTKRKRDLISVTEERRYSSRGGVNWISEKRGLRLSL